MTQEAHHFAGSCAHHTGSLAPLDQRGIHGNGHMMMLEKNNLRIARLIHNWIQNRVPSAAPSAVAR